MQLDVRAKLCEGVNRNTFFEELWACLEASDHDAKAMAQYIVDLHNARLVDAVTTFRALGQYSQAGHRFFELRQVFEYALPHLQAEPDSVAPCVAQLIEDAAGDLTARTILDSFRLYCAADSGRPSASLAAITRSPHDLHELLVATLVAGSQQAPAEFLAHTLRHCVHADLRLRAPAVFSLGKLELPDDSKSSHIIREALEQIVEKDADDSLMVSVIEATLSLSISSRIDDAQAINILHRALMNGRGESFLAASNALACHADTLSDVVRDALLDCLADVEEPPASALLLLDITLRRLTANDDFMVVRRFLEKLLPKQKHKLRMKDLPAVCKELRSNTRRLGTLVTRWLVGESKELRVGAHDIVCMSADQSLPLEIDPCALPDKDEVTLIYVARKAIGYFFEQPLTCASLVASLMRLSATQDGVASLGNLLFDPILLNSPESVRAFLKEQASVETNARVADAINAALLCIAEYLEGLRSVGVIADLRASARKQEAYQRHFALAMDTAHRKALSESVLLRMARKTLLLYGRKSVTHVEKTDEVFRRLELPLSRFTTTVDVPRMQIVDPVGLEFTLRTFRHEELLHENGA